MLDTQESREAFIVASAVMEYKQRHQSNPVKVEEKPRERVHFRFYKEFIQLLFLRGSQVGISDWFQSPDDRGFTATVIFKDNRRVFFHSKHLKWISDLTRVVDKVNTKFDSKSGTLPSPTENPAR